MKNLTKLTLIAVILLCSSSAFAQKFGYINTQELISVMPERDSVQIKLAAFSKELGTMLEAIQVEYNNKVVDYQKLKSATPATSAPMLQMKEKEIVDLQARYEEFQQNAQQEMQKMQAQLMTPVVERAENAIKKISKANGLTVVYDISSGALAYYDQATLTNLLPLVKTELGIKDVAKAAAPAAAAAAKK